MFGTTATACKTGLNDTVFPTPGIGHIEALEQAEESTAPAAAVNAGTCDTAECHAACAILVEDNCPDVETGAPCAGTLDKPDPTGIRDNGTWLELKELKS